MGIITKETKFTPFQLYLAARAVADLSFSFASPDPGAELWLDDRRDESVNPYYNQIAEGLCLEMYYSIPGSIWTPWGKWSCWGSGSGWSPKQLEPFLGMLAANIIIEQRETLMGTFGPVYSIGRIETIVLPKVVFRDRKNWLSYEEANRQWAEVTQKYYQLHGKQRPMSVSQRFDLDDMVLRIRGVTEPKLSKEDIYDIEGLESLRGKPVKYTKDGGQTWRYALIWPSPQEEFSDGSVGYATDEEVMPYAQVHCRSCLTDRDFANGLVARAVTEEEVKNIRFS